MPLFAFALEDEAPDLAPDVAPFGCCAPLPFGAFAPEEFVPVVFPVGCCGPFAVLEPVLELLLLVLPFVLLSPWLLLPAELVVATDVCGGAGGGLAGAGGTLAAGPDTPASSKAAKGWELMLWLCADACAADGEISEAAAEALGILGTLGTLELREATLVMGLLATGGPGRRSHEN